jgi:anti-anti-sigma factor
MSDPAHPRELEPHTLTTATFVEIVDTLVNDDDVIDVLTKLTARCVDLLSVAAAGILLADSTGYLRVVGASSEQVDLLELFQLQNDEGPCLDCYTTGETVTAADLGGPTPWPTFAGHSVAAGYVAVYAIPLRRNTVTLGCLNLFMSNTGPLAPTDIALAQALADVASISIVQIHANLRTRDRDEHLHHTLDSRISIEQAKGMIAEHFTVDMHTAFEMLRSHARDTAHSLTGTADQLVAGTITVDALHPPAPTQPDLSELTVEMSTSELRRIVRIGGELDLATRATCFDACVNGDGDTIEVDISALTFMDCSGYGALVAARTALEQRGATLSITHPANQPAHLLELLAEHDNATAVPVRNLKRDVSNTDPGGASEAPRTLQTAVARFLQQGLERLSHLRFSRPRVAALPKSPLKAQSSTVTQVQPTHDPTHIKPTEDRQANRQPRDSAS